MMTDKRRVRLGFDDDSDENGVEEALNPRKLQRKTKLPKFTFKTEMIESNDSNDLRPGLGGGLKEHSGLHNGNGEHNDDGGEDDSDDADDYMNIQIQEDETTGPQRLRSKEEARSKPQYDFEKIGNDKDQDNEKGDGKGDSLFGQVRDDEKQGEDKDEEDDSHFHIDVIRPISAHAKSSSKGLSIMEKMGFKIGDTLGIDKKNKDALLEPIHLVQRKGRTGIQAPRDPKIEAKIPKHGLTEKQTNDFRERLIAEDTEAVKEKLLHKMQKLCWQLTGGADIPDIETVNPLGVNVLWRGYVKFIQQMKKETRERNQVSSLLDTSLPGNNDDEIKINTIETNGDSKKVDETETPDEENEDDRDSTHGDDDELLMFQELSSDAQIEKLYMFLRTEFDYCYYCGTRYLNQKDLYSHCPGLTPEDHQ